YIGRLIPICFGLWGIFALYQLVILIWDKQHALAAATIMAILPGSAFIDRSFLPDPVMVSLTTTCMWLFVLYLCGNKTRYLLLAGFIGCLGILTKLPGLIISLPMLYAFISVYRKRGQLSFSVARPVLLTAGLVLTIVIAYYLWARYLSLHYPPYHFAGTGNWIWNDWKGMFSYYLLETSRNVFEYWIMGYPAIVLFILGFLLSPPQKNEIEAKGTIWFFHYLLLGCAFYYLIGAFELVRNAWNFQLFLPAVSVFCGRMLVVLYSLTNSSKSIKGLRVAVVVVLMIIYNVTIMRKHLFDGNNATDSYEMGKVLKTLKQPGDLVVTIAQDMGDPVAIYYSGAKGWVFPPIDHWDVKELPPNDRMSVDILKNLRSKGADWFGITGNHYSDIQSNHPELDHYLQSEMNLIDKNDAFVILKW
ncbi:MAG TPA: glycosyltransferase family 39 protein, partial [Daejeonella sp.]|nr:glycosyltransferase family 39 protein [Daejeonella sp.]